LILLDTHIWIWWAENDARLPERHARSIEDAEATGLGVSIISCWEVAKLVEGGRIGFSIPVEEWISLALSYPGVQLLDFTPRIAVESTQLPPPFHRDPADQIIVATARIHNCPLMTMDGKILSYPHVAKAP
jgi:PIN domain nuclease of toxin-antitoxin system